MNSVTSLLDFILNLLKDPQTQAEFKANPQQVLADNGLTGVCAADIHETLPLVTDDRSVELSSGGHASPPAAAGPGRGRPARGGPVPELHHEHVHLRRPQHEHRRLGAREHLGRR